MSDELGRLNAEQAVLGAMLMDTGCAEAILPRLREAREACLEEIKN